MDDSARQLCFDKLNHQPPKQSHGTSTHYIREDCFPSTSSGQAAQVRAPRKFKIKLTAESARQLCFDKLNHQPPKQSHGTSTHYIREDCFPSTSSGQAAQVRAPRKFKIKLTAESARQLCFDKLNHQPPKQSHEFSTLYIREDCFVEKHLLANSSVNLMDTKEYAVYIMTNKHNRVLYTGMTNNLRRRVYEHKTGIGSKFVKRYNVTKLVYFEVGSDVREALYREHQIKAGSRQKKVDLINELNPEWRDLYDEI